MKATNLRIWGPPLITSPILRGRGGTVLPIGVKVAVSDQSQKCQKLTKVGLDFSLQLY